MITRKFIPAVVATGLLLTAATSQAVLINYANDSGGTIQFDGAGGFSFKPAPPGHSFQVTSGTAAGLPGHISGTYTIGAITTVGPVSSAPVSGSGTFTIIDGGTPLTGTISWVDIAQIGVGSTLNVSGTVNLTAVSYGGANPDLVALATAGQAINTVTFQFTSPISLANLKTSSTAKTSFSGIIETETQRVPDSGSTALLLSAGLLGLGCLARRRS